MEISFTHIILNTDPIGKLVLCLLLLFSLASWSIIIMKALLFRKVRRESSEFLSNFWNSNNLSEASKKAEQFSHSPEATVFLAGFSELQKINKTRNRSESSEQKETLEMQLATMDNLKRAIRKSESEEIGNIGKALPFLATTGSATPFIGLFGTVWGIMNSFHHIGQRGSASLAVVAPGISEALVATAAGLAVAIPAVIFFNHYANKLSTLDNALQSFSTDFLNLVERDLLGRISS